jgi:hypothetical protein
MFDTAALGHNSVYGLPPLFRFLNQYRVGRTPWTGDQRVIRPLPIHRTIQTR